MLTSSFPSWSTWFRPQDFYLKVSFPTLWRTALKWLSDCGEVRPCKLLVKHYLEGPQEGASNVTDACWRTSFDCVRPGSASGSQPQEAWRKSRLKRFIPNLRLPFDQLHAKLQEPFEARCLETLQLQEPISDAPGYAVDSALFEGSKALRKSGRTSAKEFEKQSLALQLDGGNTAFVMRRSLFFI